MGGAVGVSAAGANGVGASAVGVGGALGSSVAKKKESFAHGVGVDMLVCWVVCVVDGRIRSCKLIK